jgi:hypothetical protein
LKALYFQTGFSQEHRGRYDIKESNLMQHKEQQKSNSIFGCGGLGLHMFPEPNLKSAFHRPFSANNWVRTFHISLTTPLIQGCLNSIIAPFPEQSSVLGPYLHHQY